MSNVIRILGLVASLKKLTAAEAVFTLVVATLGAKQRAELINDLYAISGVIQIARLTSRDPRIDEADKWVTGGLAILRNSK